MHYRKDILNIHQDIALYVLVKVLNHVFFVDHLLEHFLLVVDQGFH